MKKTIKLFILTILTSLACVLTGCGNQATGESYTEMEEKTIYAPYREEHLSLGIGYEQVAVQKDMIYGVCREAHNSTIVYQNKLTGEIYKKLPLENDLHVLSIQADEEGVVYFVGEKDGTSGFYRVENSGAYTELTGFDIEQDEKVTNEEAKGIYISEKGYYYIWWNAGVPAGELLEEYAEDERVYVYADLIYVMNESLEVVHTEKIPMYKGTRLLDLQLGQDGEALLFVKDTEGIYVKELSVEAKGGGEEKLYLEKNTSSETPTLFTVTKNGVVYCKENVLYEYDLDTKERVELLNLATYGFLPEEVMYIGKFEDTVEILDTYKETGVTEYTTLKPGESTRQMLTLAVMEQSPTMQQVVALYNRYSKEYCIDVREYYTIEGDYDAASQMLKLEIISGKAPDIIDVSNIDASVLANKGALVDLNSLMEQDTSLRKDRLISSVVRAYETDGKLFCMAPAFQLVTMWGNNQILQNRSGVSVRELMEILEVSGKGLNAIWGFSVDEPVLTTLCTFGLDEFIDWDHGTCDFTDGYFKDVLEFVKGYTGVYSDSQSKGIQENAIAITVGFVDSVADYQVAKALYGEDVDFIGYPTSTGSGTAVSFRGEALAINAKTQCIEGAWDFMKFYVKNGYNGTGFPIEKMQFEACLSLAMQPEVEVDETGAEYEVVKELYSDGDASIMIYEASEQDIEAVRKLVDSACNKYEYDVSIMSIISEEAEGYLAGQRSLDEVTEVIQNRVSLYLEEQ